MIGIVDPSGRVKSSLISLLLTPNNPTVLFKYVGDDVTLILSWLENTSIIAPTPESYVTESCVLFPVLQSISVSLMVWVVIKLLVEYTCLFTNICTAPAVKRELVLMKVDKITDYM